MMKRNPFYTLTLFFLIFLAACSPKVQDTSSTPEPTKTPDPPKVKEVDPNGCIKFSDLTTDKADDISDKYNIYRDDIKRNNFKGAFDLWKEVYETAPCTNGRIDYVFRDGLKIYNAFLEEEKDSVKREEYIAKKMEIYEKAPKCFPDNQTYFLSRQAVDLYYDYKGMATDEEIYNMLKTIAEIDGKETRVSTVIPFTTLTYNLFLAEKIGIDEARKNMETIDMIVSYNQKNCEEKECNAWTQVEQYTVALVERYEKVSGFYTCDYFVDKYYADFENKAENCEVIEDVYRAMKRGGCEKTSEQMTRLYDAFQKLCRETEEGPLTKARDCLENENYACAVQNYEDFVNSTDDYEKKAKYLLRIAKIYYAHLNNFPKGREFALKAMQYKPNWGEPLLLIGRMYASSGPLCGPGTGFDSQVVVWVAVDKWNEAKRIDPSISAEANKWIRKYEVYMPSKEDIFLRPNIDEGGKFKVGCWIQETTTVRAAKK